MTTPKADEKVESIVVSDNDLLEYLKPPAKRMTPAEIVEAGLLGGWKDRTDIKDSVEFVQKTRKRIWDEPR